MIDLTTVGFDAGGSANLEADNVLQIVENGQTYDLQLDPTQGFAGQIFQLAADGAGTGTAVTATPSATNTASPGYYEPVGAPAPIIDPAGTYTNQPGATAAIPAPAGFYDAGTGNTAATIDPAGTYTSVAGSTAATPAPAGSRRRHRQHRPNHRPGRHLYQVAGSRPPRPGARGLLMTGTGNTAASIDPAGTYTSAAGSTAAIPAPAGCYDAGTGNTAPTPAPGHYDPVRAIRSDPAAVAGWTKGRSGS